MEYQIKWKKEDYKNLRKAVLDFNKKINKLQKEEKKLYLPEPINYKETKSNIYSRQELNRVINSLRKFKKEGAEELYRTEAGEELTKWERKELLLGKKRIEKRLNKELKELSTPQKGEEYSRAQMGSGRVKEIQRELKNLQKFEKSTGYDFNKLVRRIKRGSVLDLTLKRSIVFRENYLEEMKKYSHYDNYKKFRKALLEIKNPISFFDFVGQDEIAGDLTYQSDETYTQEEFNRFIEGLGIEINTDSQSK